MTKQEYEANARNVYNLFKVTAEGLKKAREAKRKGDKECPSDSQ